jgi:hypothetical protein
MHFIAASDTLDPRTLPSTRLEQCCHELEQLTSQIFTGPNAGMFGREVLRGRFGEAVVRRYFDADGRLVGLNAITVTEVEIDGAPCSVFRGMLGLLPEFRGATDVIAFWVETVLRYRLRHPLRRLFVFSPLASAAAYRTLARRVDEFYPHPQRSTPPALEAVMQQLCERLGYARQPGDHPWVVERAAAVRHTARRGAASNDAFGEFYQRVNPRADAGKCLLVLVPVTPRALLGTAARCARAAMERLWHARPALVPARS